MYANYMRNLNSFFISFIARNDLIFTIFGYRIRAIDDDDLMKLFTLCVPDTVKENENQTLQRNVGE